MSLNQAMLLKETIEYEYNGKGNKDLCDSINRSKILSSLGMSSSTIGLGVQILKTARGAIMVSGITKDPSVAGGIVIAEGISGIVGGVLSLTANAISVDVGLNCEASIKGWSLKQGNNKVKFDLLDNPFLRFNNFKFTDANKGVTENIKVNAKGADLYTTATFHWSIVVKLNASGTKCKIKVDNKITLFKYIFNSDENQFRLENGIGTLDLVGEPMGISDELFKKICDLDNV